MSTDRSGRGEPVALLVTDDERPDRLVRGGAAGEIRVLSCREAAGLAPFPSRPLVLVAGPPPPPRIRSKIARIARRGRHPGWFALAPAGLEDEAARGWHDVADEVLTAPVGADVLRLLARSLRRGDAEQREAAKARREARSLERRLTVLSETLRAAGALLDPRMVSHFIMQRAAALVRTPRWRLYRVDENRGSFRLEAHFDPTRTQPPVESLPLDRGVAGVAARTREIVHVKDPAGDPRVDRLVEWPDRAPSALLAAPMVSRGRVIGVIELADPESGRLTKRDVDLIRTLMEPAAIALDNADLFRKLEERTVTDDLTQLYNARFMENYLRREAKRAVRYGHPVALLFIDLDGFKQVNDVHGHMAGSRTLVEVGEVLRENVREIDVVARWGGDEFAVVLPDTGCDGAYAMAERIREKIGAQSYLEEIGLDVHVSASIGVAAYPEHGASAEGLLAAADAAMYRVKDSGKNGVRLAEPAREMATSGV